MPTEQILSSPADLPLETYVQFYNNQAMQSQEIIPSVDEIFFCIVRTLSRDYTFAIKSNIPYSPDNIKAILKELGYYRAKMSVDGWDTYKLNAFMLRLFKTDDEYAHGGYFGIKYDVHHYYCWTDDDTQKTITKVQWISVYEKELREIAMAVHLILRKEHVLKAKKDVKQQS